MNRQFRSRAATPRLTPEQAARQGRVSTLAFEALRNSQAVIAFLNTNDDALGGRPIDLAVASQDGLTRVERKIAALQTPDPLAARSGLSDAHLSTEDVIR